MLSKLNNSNLGCHIKSRCYNAIMYADDLLLMSITISDLQNMINLCVSELCSNDLSVNALKSVCLRVGARHNCTTCTLSVNTQVILWLNKLSFLSFTFFSGPNFKCNLNGV